MEQFFGILQQTELFENMSREEIRSMLSCLGYHERVYPKNNIIWNTGDIVRSFGIVLDGQAQVLRDDLFGKRNILASITPGGVFGEAFACAGLPESPVSVMAGQTATRVLFLNVEKVLTLCSHACAFHNELIARLVRMLARKNIALNEKIDFLGKRTTREKIGAFLLSSYRRQKSNPFLIEFNRNELADFLSVDRSALSRELSAMKRAGLIDYWKNSFKILDFQKME